MRRKLADHAAYAVPTLPSRNDIDHLPSLFPATFNCLQEKHDPGMCLSVDQRVPQVHFKRDFAMAPYPMRRLFRKPSLYKMRPNGGLAVMPEVKGIAELSTWDIHNCPRQEIS
jgi:hypothetical protein